MWLDIPLASQARGSRKLCSPNQYSYYNDFSSRYDKISFICYVQSNISLFYCTIFCSFTFYIYFFPYYLTLPVFVFGWILNPLLHARHKIIIELFREENHLILGFIYAPRTPLQRESTEGGVCTSFIHILNFTTFYYETYEGNQCIIILPYKPLVARICLHVSSIQYC